MSAENHIKKIDDFFMKRAIGEANIALAQLEVPIGAIVVKMDAAYNMRDFIDDEDLELMIIGRGYNLVETLKDPIAHAEISAIREAAKNLDSWRLSGCTMYVTAEPCPMCAGAIVNARIKRVVAGVKNPKAGACTSLYNIVSDSRLNHQVSYVDGVLEEECSLLLKEFFHNLREKSSSNSPLGEMSELGKLNG